MQGVQKCLGTLADVGCLLAQVRTTCRATWWWDAGDGSRRPVRSSVHAFMVILSRMETSQRVHKSAWRFTFSILSRRKQKKKVATTPSADRKYNLVSRNACLFVYQLMCLHTWVHASVCTSVSLQCRCELSSGSCPRRYCYPAKVCVCMHACKCFLRVMFDLGENSHHPNPYQSPSICSVCVYWVSVM